MSGVLANISLFQAISNLPIKKEKFHILIKYTLSNNNAFVYEDIKKKSLVCFICTSIKRFLSFYGHLKDKITYIASSETKCVCSSFGKERVMSR